MATFDTNNSIADSRQTVTALVQKFPDIFSEIKAALAIDRIDVSGETIRLSISLRLAVDFSQTLT